VKSVAAHADNSADAFLGAVGLAELKRLIRLVQATGIGELEIQSGTRTVRISAQGRSMELVPAAGYRPGPIAPGPPASPAGAMAAAPSASQDEKTVAITSPMVGTFYRAPAPDADPYVETGDRVEVGQTVCIVEAMKLMNEIEADVKGRVVQVLVENAQPVEFGQKLFLVQPD
jgi:acetyl-CoA carboxylase biotin carboxyl carrier protein